jgi:hypothetical protein
MDWSVYCPLEELLPYQQLWVDDASRWKFGLMARQVGKDFSCAFEGVRECRRAQLERKKIDWLIAAPSERHSLESLQKWRDWAEAFELNLTDYVEEREGGPDSLLKSATLVFRGGSRVIAVPGKPDTVRGFSANVLLTEFAFFEDPDATWRAIMPSIANPLRGGEKKVRLITTPNGIGNRAHELWNKNFTGGNRGNRVNDKKEEKTGERKSETSAFSPSSSCVPGGSDGETPSEATGTVAVPRTIVGVSFCADSEGGGGGVGGRYRGVAGVFGRSGWAGAGV